MTAHYLKNLKERKHDREDYSWKHNHKLANFAVMDVDLLDGDVMTFPEAKILATIVDGNVVYENK